MSGVGGLWMLAAMGGALTTGVEAVSEGSGVRGEEKENDAAAADGRVRRHERITRPA